MGVIITPILLYVGTRGSVNKRWQRKTTHRVSLQWSDEINAGVPFSSLSCPAMTRVLAWA